MAELGEAIDLSKRKGGGAMMRCFYNTPAEKAISTLHAGSAGVDTLRLNEERRLP